MPQAEDQQPDTDPFGHRAWAADQGISPATALMLAATALAHISGPTLSWEGSFGLNGRRPPNLLGAGADLLLRSGIDHLFAPLRVVQQMLIQASHEFPLELVDKQFVRGCDNMRVGEQTLRLSINADELHDIRDADHEHEKMLDLGFRTRHRENLLHPVFLAESLPSGPLAGMLLQCNHGACCLAGALENLPSDIRKRHQRIDELMRYLDGAVIDTRQSPVTRIKDVSLRGILLFRQDDLHWLMEERRDFLLKFIPIASNPPAHGEARDIDQEKVDTFTVGFHRAARHALALRRSFFTSEKRFTCEEARSEFTERRRRYRLRAAQAPTDLTTVPDLLMWFLLQLSQRHDERALVDLAMDTVETVHRESCRTFAVHDNMQLGLKRQQNARKMLRHISERGPLKRSELVRIFNKQSLEIHGPVIDALIAHGFLSKDKEERLHLGPTPASGLTLDHMIDEYTPNPIQ